MNKEKAREEIIKGKFLTEAEAKKRLGLATILNLGTTNPKNKI